MKYGRRRAGPLVVSVQLLRLRWNSSATPRQTAAWSRSPLRSAIFAAASRPAISEAIVDGEKPLCSSQRSGPDDGPVAGDEVRRRLDVRLVVVAAGQPDGERHDQRVGALVELGVEAVGRLLAVGEAVARHRAVGQLLALEQEARHVARRPRGRRPGTRRPRLVEVAREHLAVGAEVGVARGRRRRRPGPTARRARRRPRRGTSCPRPPSRTNALQVVLVEQAAPARATRRRAGASG